jgi:hypothetical protein
MMDTEMQKVCQLNAYAGCTAPLTIDMMASMCAFQTLKEYRLWMIPYEFAWPAKFQSTGTSKLASVSSGDSIP